MIATKTELFRRAVFGLSRHIGLMAGAGLLLRNAADAVAILGGGLRVARREWLRLAHLDENGALLGVTAHAGGHDALALSPGKIVRDVFAHGARRLLLAHNHPSGDPTPSRADHVATRRLAELMRALEIELVDHLVFARDGVTSFRGSGLL